MYVQLMLPHPCLWPLCTSYIRAYFAMVLLMCQQFNLQGYQQLVYLYFIISKIIFFESGVCSSFCAYLALSHNSL